MNTVAYRALSHHIIGQNPRFCSVIPNRKRAMLATMHPHEAADYSPDEHDRHIGMSEDGRPEPAVGFPFGEIDRDDPTAVQEIAELHAALTDIEREKFLAGMQKIFRWIYQDPHHRNLDGIQIRALIFAWITVKELQPLNLTQLARMYGKDKQSFGRWVDEFKREFPWVRNSHMKE